jgi:hypothetical protein
LAILAAFAAIALSCAAAHAQMQMPGGQPSPGGAAPGSNPVCQRLEGQLALIDRGGGADPARADQLRRYEEAASRQQSELDRVTAQAKRMGCDSSGFFALFSGQNAQCGPVNTQIQQMRANLDQMTSGLERLRAGQANPERDGQRRSVIAALAQNNCGPQYASQARSGGFLDGFFGGGQVQPPSADLGPPSSTFRTVCVRSCDGFYFPISFATTPSRFADDEKACKSLCPASEATLYTYRNPGEDMNQAVSINGTPYPSSPNAFRYRQEFNPSCSCKAQGQTWADALKNVDDKTSAENGDIIVTEEQAKRMAQPQGGKAAPASTKKNAAPAPAASPANTTATTAVGGSSTDGKPIRSVGPTFIPQR